MQYEWHRYGSPSKYLVTRFSVCCKLYSLSTLEWYCWIWMIESNWVITLTNLATNFSLMLQQQSLVQFSLYPYFSVFSLSWIYVGCSSRALTRCSTFFSLFNNSSPLQTQFSFYKKMCIFFRKTTTIQKVPRAKEIKKIYFLDVIISCSSVESQTTL